MITYIRPVEFCPRNKNASLQVERGHVYCIRRGLLIWLKPSRIYSVCFQEEKCRKIFCPVLLDMEQRRVSLCVQQGHIVCFSMARYQFIQFLFRAFNIIINAHAVSFQEFISNIIMKFKKHYYETAFAQVCNDTRKPWTKINNIFHWK